MDKFDTLYHKGKKGAIYQWTVWSENDEILTEYGQVGGQMQISCKKAEAKNVGKINATTPEEQAKAEAKSMFTFKIERKYSRSIEECKQRKYSPMLAPGKDFSETKKWVTYPCHVQPKLDGNRCLAYWQDDRIVLMSRGGKEWTNLDHIVKQLQEFLPEDCMLDGELYLHGESCQTITSWIKKYRPGITEKIEFWIYDIPIHNGEELIWKDRQENLEELEMYLCDASSNMNVKVDNIKVLTTELVHSEQQIYQKQSEYLQNGYEGLMVRLQKGEYEWGYRSKSLLKCKEFQDAEYEIIGYSNGKGKNETTVTWECIAPNGKTFNVVPKGTFEERENWLEHGDDYIGKMLKVKFQNLTDDGLPRFPTAIMLREEMDLS